MINLFKNKDKMSFLSKLFMFIIMSVLVFVSVKGVGYYRYIYSPSISLGDSDFLYLKNNSSIEDVVLALEKNFSLKNKQAFLWVAQRKHYTNKIKGGRYKLKSGMNNNAIVNLLRSGLQDPVKLTFNNTRTLKEFAGKISRQIDIDSLCMIKYLNDSSRYSKYGFDRENIISMFIPNTYHVYWNTNIESFVRKMNREYIIFWNKENLQKAEKINLSPLEVSVLASIIDEETNKNDEKPMVAGVYVNRIIRGMKLDADPTLKFALGDFSIKRVLNIHKKIDSPYNTYMYAGLPPGPIRQASLTGIKSVLNYSKHKYIFFCANADFSGYHSFATNMRQHGQNARDYQRALNKRKIYK